MILSKDYVEYMTRQVLKRLEAAKVIVIHPDQTKRVTERVNHAVLEELQLEDRINEEVRMILDAYQEDMRRSGASYPEMFKKVKNELARKYKAVL